MYLKPLGRKRVGLSSVPDFLFPTTEGFLDVLEIKLPTKPAIVPDSRRYAWSRDTNLAIAVSHSIQEMESNQANLERTINRIYGEHLDHRVTILRPRAFILIGTEERWNDQAWETHRHLNSSLQRIEVLTYDELLRRGRKTIDLYTEEAAQTDTADQQ